MKLQIKRRRLIPVAIAMAAVIAVSGVAYAFWTASGSGTGSATVGTSQALTVSQTNTVTGLVPDGVDHDVIVHVVNPATFSQSLNADAISVHQPSLPSGCLVGWFTVTSPTIAPPVVLTATGTPGSSADFTGKIKMTDSGTNQDACKNPPSWTLVLDIVVS